MSGIPEKVYVSAPKIDVNSSNFLYLLYMRKLSPQRKSLTKKRKLYAKKVPDFGKTAPRRLSGSQKPNEWKNGVADFPMPSEKSYWHSENDFNFARKYENAERFSLNPPGAYTKVRPESRSGTKHKHNAIMNKTE